MEQNATFATLRSKLLDIAGTSVKEVYEEDLKKLSARGKSYDDYKIFTKKGVPSRCHMNSAIQYRKNQMSGKNDLSIVTGWELDADGIWRQHSWVVNEKKKMLIETTFPRIRYFGFTLSDREADNFVMDNL